jgi:hypothetical protein
MKFRQGWAIGSQREAIVDSPILGTPSPFGGWRFAHYDGIVASVWFWFRSPHG